MINCLLERPKLFNEMIKGYKKEGLKQAKTILNVDEMEYFLAPKRTDNSRSHEF